VRRGVGRERSSQDGGGNGEDGNESVLDKHVDCWVLKDKKKKELVEKKVVKS
jgi:hypothetical protein